MSIPECVAELRRQDKVSKGFADRMLDLYGQEFRRLRRDMGHEAAEAEASELVLRRMEADRALKLRQNGQQILSQRNLLADMAGFNGGKGGQTARAAMALLDHDGQADYMNVSTQRQAIVGRAHSVMQAVIEKFERDVLGRMPSPADMADVIRELFGEDSGSHEAKKLAEAWNMASEYLRQRFNAAGGSIGKLVRWGLPQAHDMIRVADAGLNAWKAFIMPLLDTGRMTDRDGNSFNAAGLDAALDDVFDTISTDGWINREPGSGGGRGKLANSRADHRFLIFKDADGWMAYREKFGAGGTPFDAMLGHVDGMARDIAHMERLGPNPAATIGMLQDHIIKEAKIAGRRDTWASSATGGAEALGKLFDTTSGKSAIPVNSKWSKGLSAARSGIVAAKLGGAVFSAISDTGFQAMTRLFNGMPVWGALTDHIKLMASPENRRAAVRLGLIAEESGKQAASINRYMGESVMPGITSRLADGVLRVTGLSAWTQTGKWAYGLGQLGHLAELGDHGWDALDGLTRASLARYGIDEGGWDAIRSAERMNVGAADFVDPTRIADHALGDRLLRMVLTETAYAVPEVTARAKAMTTFGRPGSLGGEVGRSILQFKSFSASMLLTHGRRAMSMSPYGGAAYAAGLFVTTTLLGALAVQMKEIVKGRDPRDMTDWTFWKDAALQGGGLGIIGDFVGNALSPLEKAAGIQRAGSLPEMLLGPLAGAATDAIRLGAIAPVQDVQDWVNGGKGGHVAKEVIRDLKGYTPGASIWYARLAMERLVLDNLQAQIDPNHAHSWEMMERHANQRGQQFWWHPGQTAPERAPTMKSTHGLW